MVDAGVGIAAVVSIGSKFIERSKFTARHELSCDKEAEKSARLVERFDRIPKEDVDQFELEGYNSLHSKSTENLQHYRSVQEEYKQKEWIKKPLQKAKTRRKVRQAKRALQNSSAQEECHVHDLEAYSRSSSSCGSSTYLASSSDSGLGLNERTSRPYRSDSCSTRAIGGSPPYSNLDDIRSDEEKEDVIKFVSNWIRSSHREIRDDFESAASSLSAIVDSPSSHYLALIDPPDVPWPDSARLPSRLIRMIIAHINDRASLYALTLSSHFLRHETEPYLYASPMTPFSSPSHLPTQRSLAQSKVNNDPTTHLAFLRTVTSAPRLAALVKSYHSINMLWYAETPLWRYTAQALRMMSGLRELRLLTLDGRPAAGSLLLEQHPLRERKDETASPPFQLHTLHWGCHSDERDVAEFLATQHELRELFIDTSSFLFSNSIISPQLDCIGGNCHTIEAIVPCRSIKHVAWISNIADWMSDKHYRRQINITEYYQQKSHLIEKKGLLHVQVNAAWGQVRVLEIGGTLSWDRFINLAKYLQKLEVLELPVWDIFTTPDREALFTLPVLRELIFSITGTTAWTGIVLPPGMFPSSSSSCGDDYQANNKNDVTSLFASMPSLQLLDVELESREVPMDIKAVNGARLYARWKRDCYCAGVSAAVKECGERDCECDVDGEVRDNNEERGTKGRTSGQRGHGQFELLTVDEVRWGRLPRRY